MLSKVSKLALAGIATASATTAPPDVSSLSWTIIANDIATISTGIAITGEGTVIAVGASSESSDDDTSTSSSSSSSSSNSSSLSGMPSPSLVLISDDWGVTFSPTNDSFALLLLDTAGWGNTAVATGLLTATYSTNLNAGSNADFDASNVTAPAGQSIRIAGDVISGFDDSTTAIFGQFGLFTESNGFAVSTDSGANYNVVNITQLSTSARYGFLSDAQNILVAAGDWPGEGSDDDSSSHLRFAPNGERIVRVQQVNPRYNILIGAEGGLYNDFDFSLRSGNSTGYSAEIVLTQDGGNTFDFVEIVPDNNINTAVYYNDIDCSSSLSNATGTVCAVAEGSIAQIWCSFNGPKGPYTAVYNGTNAPDTQESLMDIAPFTQANGVAGWVAVGAVMGQFGPNSALALLSEDDGHTWTQMNTTALGQVMMAAVECISANPQNTPVNGAPYCVASVLSLLQISSIAAFTIAQ